jgi:hypothetical protein
LPDKPMKPTVARAAPALIGVSVSPEIELISSYN